MRWFWTQLCSTLWLCVLVFPLFAADNPCQDKYWLESPRLELGEEDGSGIGGTGFSSPVGSQRTNNQGEEGIGGTGIVGVIAGFGSICVNGMEIHYDATTPTLEDGFPIANVHLSLGQTVSVSASPTIQGFQAQKIQVLHEVQGVIEAKSSDEATLRLLGQTVRLPLYLLDQLAVGDTVAVSGNRLPDGSIATVLVEQRSPTEHVGLIGTLHRDSDGRLLIGKQVLEFDDPASPEIGEELMLRGVLKGEVLHVTSFERNPRLAFVGKPEQMLLQGYVRPSEQGIINIDGVRIVSERIEGSIPQAGERAGAWVRIGDSGHLVLDHWHVRPLMLEHGPGKSTNPELGESVGVVSHPGEHQEQAARHVSTPGNLVEPEIGMLPRPTGVTSDFHHPRAESSNGMRPEINRPAIEKPHALRPEVNRIELNKPQLVRPEINRPGNERPQFEKPGHPRPSIDRPEHGRPGR